jgi:transposase
MRKDTIKNIASYYGIESQKMLRHYKREVSGYSKWSQKSHAGEYLLYPENITDKLSIDELSLSKGELYTFITNKNTKVKNKKTLVAVINGTQSSLIESVIKRIPETKREQVKEVTMDMAGNMSLAIKRGFPISKRVIDRFHTVKLVIEAMQHIRIKLRWLILEQENEKIKQAKKQGKKYKAEILSNGDTLRELLARSRYLLYKYEENWTNSQSQRAKLLFRLFPKLEQAYKLCIIFRNFYKSKDKTQAKEEFYKWKSKVKASELVEFNTAVNSIENHLEGILNYFDNRSTNANAESFNSKIKSFRANLRGVRDVNFFLEAVK